MRRSHCGQPLLLAVGVVAVGGVFRLVRSLRHKAMAAREAKKVTNSEAEPTDDVVDIAEAIDEEVVDATSPVGLDDMVVNQLVPIGNSSIGAKAAQKCVVSTFSSSIATAATAVIKTPAFNHLALQLPTLLPELDEQQKTGLVEPTNVATTAETNAKDAKEDIITPPLRPIKTVAALANFDRSVSNASSVGTPGGATPLSAHGSVLGPFNINNGTVAIKATKKSALVRVDQLKKTGDKDGAGGSCYGGSNSGKEKRASEFKLNPNAKEFVPTRLNPYAKEFVSTRLNAYAKEFVSKWWYVDEFGSVVGRTAGEIFLLEWAERSSS
ncbi:hypothetical protein Ndes2526B_g00996 [Nannochloris sp. 'desiccata']|nr:hypothetical protein KSW81_002176 [Chlorella desiccata (nom. nud.)]